jgi:hypothetical protein
MFNHFKKLCKATEPQPMLIWSQTCFQNDMHPHSCFSHKQIPKNFLLGSSIGRFVLDQLNKSSFPYFRGLWIFQRNYKFKPSYYLKVKPNPTLAPVSSKAASRKQLFYSLSPFLSEGKSKVCPKQQQTALR